MSDISELIKYERKKWVESRNLTVKSIEDINNGWCNEFAKSIKDALSQPKDFEIRSYGYGNSSYRSSSHKWVYYQGKHYDAECPEGVKNPRNLPFFERNSINPES
jgi:hypothetical protein